MIVYTLLFTLQSKNPTENKYIQMFYIWLTYLLKYGGLTKDDTICVLCDEKTLEQLNSNEILSTLMELCQSQFTIQSIQQLENISQGMIARYTFQKENEFVLYLDLDVLVKRNIKEYFSNISILKNCLFALPEGKLWNVDYGGHFLEKNELTENHPGFTSGLFGYIWGDDVKQFMNAICVQCLQNQQSPFYTIDQPFYNKEVYLRISKQIESKLKIYLIDENCVENNPDMLEGEKGGVFVNMCGEPGNDTLHFQKMLLHLCFSFIKQSS